MVSAAQAVGLGGRVGVCHRQCRREHLDPTNLTLGQRGEWEDCLLVETVLSMLTLVRHFKKVMPRVWEYCYTQLACTMAALTVLVQWHGVLPHASGFVPLSSAELRL